MPDIHLVIGGGSTKPQPTEAEILATMRQVIDEKELQARVHVVGYMPEELLVPAYQNSEFFVLPSVFEPFGITALEAMACGKPIVASKLGGIRSHISPPKNGLLVDPRNLGEFADAMIMLLRDQGMAHSMGQEARRTVETLASWEAIAARHLTFYESYCSLVE